MNTLRKFLLALPILLIAVWAQGAPKTQTIASNLVISAPFTSPAVTLTGSLVNATVQGSVSSAIGTQIHFVTEISPDGVQPYTPFDTEYLGGSTKSTTLGFGFTLPNALGASVRVRVLDVTGSVTLTSLTVTN